MNAEEAMQEALKALPESMKAKQSVVPPPEPKQRIKMQDASRRLWWLR